MNFVIISDSGQMDYVADNFAGCANEELQIACFAMSRPKMQQFREYPVIDDAFVSRIKCDAVLIAVKANRTLQRILIRLYEQKVSDIYVVTLYALDKRRDFLSGGHMDERYVHHLTSQEDKPYLVHLETHVCDHCNLNCKACNNFSPFVREPKYADPVRFEQDMGLLAERFSNIGRFFLLGGEPLLAPQLCCQMTACFRRYFPGAELRLLTNAILIAKMTPEFWTCMRENRVIIHISLYPPMAPALDRIEETLRANGVDYVIARAVKEFRKHWGRYPLEDERRNNELCGSAGCHYLREGVIAKCPDAILIGNMEPKLVSHQNISLSESGDAWEIIRRLEGPVDLCRKCAFRNEGIIPWDRVEGETDQADWLLESSLERERRQMAEKCDALERESRIKSEELQKLEDMLRRAESETSDREKRMAALQRDLDERERRLREAERETEKQADMAEQIRRSLSYRIGRGFTYFPRRARHVIKTRQTARVMESGSAVRTERKNAIEVRDVCINYRILNNTSVQKSVLRRKEKEIVFEAVRHVSFAVERGGIMGIIGRNGSGKSTLLRSIAGVFSPNAGEIDLMGHSVSLMALGVGFKDMLTGRENIVLSGMLLGFTERQISEHMDEIIEFAEIGDFIDRPVRTYSSGMHSKLAFAITAMLETDIMLVDEVLSVGDERFRKKSLEKMRSLILDRDRTVIIVSHDKATLLELCDRVLWLHDGEVMEIGEPAEVLEHYVQFMSR